MILGSLQGLMWLCLLSCPPTHCYIDKRVYAAVVHCSSTKRLNAQLSSNAAIAQSRARAPDRVPDPHRALYDSRRPDRIGASYRLYRP
jgi:hypothetical protein